MRRANEDVMRWLHIFGKRYKNVISRRERSGRKISILSVQPCRCFQHHSFFGNHIFLFDESPFCPSIYTPRILTLPNTIFENEVLEELVLMLYIAIVERLRILICESGHVPSTAIVNQNKKLEYLEVMNVLKIS